jgi:hypothetical protein
MKAAKRLLLFFVLVLPGMAAAAADNVPGYEKTRWGMTEDEVKRVVGAVVDLTPPDRYRDGVYGPFYQQRRVNRYVFEVRYQFTPEQRLCQVVLTAEGTDPGRWVVVRDWLEGMYGAPTSEKSERITEKMTWRFKSTEVEAVKMAGLSGVIKGSTTIRYTAVAP